MSTTHPHPSTTPRVSSGPAVVRGATLDPGPMRKERGVPRWPVHAITSFVGLFCVIVGAAWVWDHGLRGTPVDATGWIVAGATVLRLLTIVIALAAIQQWGRRVPARVLSMGLWGCAAAQLVYPLAETATKAAVLTGLVDLPARGLGNMTAVGWFNFSMVWLVFGIPGALFALVGRTHQRAYGLSWVWPMVGLAGGVAVLFGIGAVIS